LRALTQFQKLTLARIIRQGVRSSVKSNLFAELLRRIVFPFGRAS